MSIEIEGAGVNAATNENTGAAAGQAADAISENANIQDHTPAAVEWRGNKDYFQSGAKAGQLKPRAAARGAAPKELGGLDIESLTATASELPQQEQAPAKDKKAAKAERKLVEAKTGAKMAMRMLDLITKWISKGTYGADFTPQQRKERNEYREALEKDWEDYLLTLDIPMHPALVVAFGSITYVGEAFTTQAGQETVQNWKEKIISKIAVGIFSRRK